MWKFFSLPSSSVLFLPVLACLLLTVACCTGGQWRQPGKSRAQFGLDSAECSARAESEAIAASLNKDRPIRAVREHVYERCLMELGWSPLGDEPPPPPRPALSAAGVHCFGRLVVPPAGFTSTAEVSGTVGPSAWTRIVMRGPAGQNLILAFQESAQGFEEAPYPVPRGFAAFDRGVAGGHDWTVFTGGSGRELAVVLGSYIAAGGNRRISVTVAEALPEAERPPPSGNLALSENRKTAAEAFTRRWTAWLAKNPRNVNTAPQSRTKKKARPDHQAGP
jgi:hypothetical protein